MDVAWAVVTHHVQVPALLAAPLNVTLDVVLTAQVFAPAPVVILVLGHVVMVPAQVHVLIIAQAAALLAEEIVPEAVHRHVPVHVPQHVLLVAEHVLRVQEDAKDVPDAVLHVTHAQVPAHHVTMDVLVTVHRHAQVVAKGVRILAVVAPVPVKMDVWDVLHPVPMGVTAVQAVAQAVKQIALIHVLQIAHRTVTRLVLHKLLAQ